jgi:hypothetical protein
MIKFRLTFIAGLAMVALSLVGVVSVADDWRHVGEIAGTVALFLGGLALVGDGLGILAERLALRWVSLGLLAGAFAGAVADRMAAGVAGGLVLGLILAHLRRTPRAAD